MGQSGMKDGWKVAESKGRLDPVSKSYSPQDMVENCGFLLSLTLMMWVFHGSPEFLSRT